MTEFSQSYYEDIRGRLQALSFLVAEGLPVSTRDFVAEELDYMELGLALETMVEVLAETGYPVDQEVAAEFKRLAEVMGMTINVETLQSNPIIDQAP